MNCAVTKGFWGFSDHFGGRSQASAVLLPTTQPLLSLLETGLGRITYEAPWDSPPPPTPTPTSGNFGLPCAQVKRTVPFSSPGHRARKHDEEQSNLTSLEPTRLSRFQETNSDRFTEGAMELTSGYRKCHKLPFSLAKTQL